MSDTLSQSHSQTLHIRGHVREIKVAAAVLLTKHQTMNSDWQLLSFVPIISSISQVSLGSTTLTQELPASHPWFLAIAVTLSCSPFGRMQLRHGSQHWPGIWCTDVDKAMQTSQGGPRYVIQVIDMGVRRNQRCWWTAARKALCPVTLSMKFCGNHALARR